jgi:hypothetical protein
MTLCRRSRSTQGEAAPGRGQRACRPPLRLQNSQVPRCTRAISTYTLMPMDRATVNAQRAALEIIKEA